MSKKTLRNLIVSSMLLLLATAAVAFLLFKIYQQGTLLVQQIETIRAERSQEDTFYRLQRVAEESIGDRQAVGSYFLREESDTIEFLTQIESLAPQAGVVLKTEGLEKKTDKATNVQSIDVTISFSGSEDNVETFMRMLENLPYLLKVTSLDMSAQSSTLWQAKVTLRVQLLPYDK
jgi:Tfp pilus assembly protein PilN